MWASFLCLSLSDKHFVLGTGWLLSVQGLPLSRRTREEIRVPLSDGGTTADCLLCKLVDANDDVGCRAGTSKLGKFYIFPFFLGWGRVVYSDARGSVLTFRFTNFYKVSEVRWVKFFTKKSLNVPRGRRLGTRCFASIFM